MGIETGHFTPSGTGIQEYTGLLHLPSFIVFQGGQEGASSDSVARYFSGWSDLTNSRADSFFEDSSGRDTTKSTTSCILLKNRDGSIVTDLECELDSWYDDTFGDYGFVLNQLVCDISVQIGYVSYYQ